MPVTSVDRRARPHTPRTREQLPKSLADSDRLVLGSHFLSPTAGLVVSFPHHYPMEDKHDGEQTAGHSGRRPDAAARLEGVAHRTPVLRSRTLDALVGAEVFLKCENFQRIGAFKFRGAYNAVARLTPEELARGVVAYSSGNHAQAVALAARELGTTRSSSCPRTPRGQDGRHAGYGAEIVTYDRYTDDREAIADALAAERGLSLIPPYDHPHVIAGQGTAALELIEEAGDLGRAARAGRRRRADRGHCHRREGPAARHPRGRRRAGGRGRHQAVAAARATGSPSPYRARSPTARPPTIPGELTFSDQPASGRRDRRW